MLLKILIIVFCIVIIFTSFSFAQEGWIKIGDMPQIRFAHTVNEINGQIYIIGGWRTESDTVQPNPNLIYNRSTETWSELSLIPNNDERGAHTSCVVDNKLYVIGGWACFDSTSASVDMYNPETGEWSSMKSMPTHRANLSCVAIDGKIYAMGGLRRISIQDVNYTGLTTMEMYDISNDTWTIMEDMPTGRWGLSAIVVSGKIYVFGGRTTGRTSAYSRVDVFDPKENSWNTKTDMPTKRYQLTTCLLNDKIYAIGGWGNSATGPIYDKVEVFDLISEEWTTETPMPDALALLSSLTYDGKIYVYGGSYKTHPLKGTSTIYEYTPVTGIEDNLSRIQDAFALNQNYPNPFNPSTSIEFTLPKSEYVELKIYNILGKEVSILVSNKLNQGNHTYTFDGKNLASGIYYYQIMAGEYREVKKMILLR